MPRDRGYITWRPHNKTLVLLDEVEKVLDTYRDNLPMTLRQIFYVLVGRLILEKSQAAYIRLGHALRKARRARMIPFEAIHDQGSVMPYSLLGHQSEGDLGRLLRAVAHNFDLDRQRGQRERLVLWCEAAGMIAQLERVAHRYGVQVVSGGGFDSLSDKWTFGAKLAEEVEEAIHVLHIGDLDPHGESIFDVLSEDVPAFVNGGAGHVTFARLAVTREQVAELGLPTAFDSDNVQAEAIPPDVLSSLVHNALRKRLDLDLMARVAEETAKIRERAQQALRAAEL